MRLLIKPALAGSLLAAGAFAAGTALVSGGGASSAASGLAFPGPLGSTWEIVSGYNTATHTGDDPFAIDVVRRDAESAGTPVLAPFDGTIGYASGDCITLRDERGVRLLVCHLLAHPGLERGVEVRRGERAGHRRPGRPGRQ